MIYFDFLSKHVENFIRLHFLTYLFECFIMEHGILTFMILAKIVLVPLSKVRIKLHFQFKSIPKVML